MIFNLRYLLSSIVASAILVLIFIFPSTYAEADPSVPPPSSACSISPLDQWSAQEKWVWSKVCAASEADLAAEYGGTGNPSDSQSWPAERILRSRFLETLLLKEPFHSALGPKGLRLTGAKLQERLDLEGADIKSELWITRSVLEQGATLERAHATKRITFEGTVSTGEMSLKGLSAEQDFRMLDSSFTAIDLNSARIAGALFLQRTKVTAQLNLNDLRVGSGLFLRFQSDFKDVILRGAKIEGQFELVQATIKGTLDMDSVEVGSNLLMTDSTLGKVVLREATVGRDIATAGSQFTDYLNLDSLEVKGNLRLDGATFDQIGLHGTRVAGEFGLWKSTVNGTIDAGSMNIGSSLILGRQRCTL